MADDDAFEELKALARSAEERTRNEAETRHKVIDFVIHRVLAWPTNRVGVEEHIRPGFADYVLKKPNDDPIILIEAKREGVFFSLPQAHDPVETSAYISLDKLMTDPAIADAVKQVRGYCVDVGCEYAAITNGYEWIFYKTFERSRRWDTTRAFVVRRLAFFEQEYTRAINALSYAAIVERSSLVSLLTGGGATQIATACVPWARETDLTAPATSPRSNPPHPLKRPSTFFGTNGGASPPPPQA